MIRPFISKHHLTLFVLPFALLLGGIKWYIHEAGLDFMELNAYFSTLVAADVFLLGFLLSGAMPDYKEAEKIPGEIACAFDSVVDECSALQSNTKARKEATQCLQHTRQSLQSIIQWFHHKEKTRDVVRQLRDFAPIFTRLEPHTQANFLVRLKQEIASVRRMVIRMRNIREASVVAPAYAVSELFTGIVIVSMLFVEMKNPFEESFIVAAISYLLIYMIALIRDLDNPFQYHDKAHIQDEVAIEALEAVDRSIVSILKKSK
jgi:hypothetical protein